MTEPTGSTGTHYRLTNHEWLMVWNELRPAELKILYHLRTLDPFGDRELDIKVRELGRTLGLTHPTVSRALRRLNDLGYIDLDLINVNIKLRSRKVVPTDTTGASRHRSRSSDTTGDRQTPPAPSEATPKLPSSREIQAFSTDRDFVPEQTLKNTVKQNSGGHAPPPAPEPLNGKGYSAISEISQLIPERAGVPLNAALIAVIQKIHERHPEEAYERVSNAISAYLEQSETVLNPQAYISAALQRGFTSNRAKKQGRKQQPKQKETGLPPPPLDLSTAIATIARHCDRLEITTQQAMQRMGWAPRPPDELSPYELVNLSDAIQRWNP